MADNFWRWPGVLLFSGLAAYLLLAWLARPVPEHPFFERAGDGPLVLAHQGGDGLWPGDTLLAFEQAMALGVDVLEMDVHATADGVLVLMHDETVDRTTNGTGFIRDMTLADLQTLDAGYHWSADGGQTFPFRGQGIRAPALAEVVSRFPDALYNIEIKQAEPDIGQALCDLLQQRQLLDQALIASFRESAMRSFRAVCPGAATSGVESEIRQFYTLNLLFLGALYQARAEAFQVPEYSGERQVVTARFVRQAQGHNVAVHVWTVNETEDMARLLALGVDGIITDYPDRLLDLLGR